MRVSYDVFHFRNAQRGELPFRYHNYDVSHFGGPQQNVPNLLINQHRIDDIADAEAYVARIAATEKLMDQAIASMGDAKAKGITLPRFSYALMIDDAGKVARGAPFAGKGENDIFADFKRKVEKLDAGAAAKSKLIADAQNALTQKLGPAYAASGRGPIDRKDGQTRSRRALPTARLSTTNALPTTRRSKCLP
jgi:uncharacterized protein (DUF885 family)